MPTAQTQPLSPGQIAIAETEKSLAEVHARIKATNEYLAESNKDFKEMVELMQTYVPDFEPEMFAKAHALAVSIEQLTTMSDDAPAADTATTPAATPAAASTPSAAKPRRRTRNLV
ncbi:hypothetical protein [Paraburkholderia hayleyella]|uniref:hypothetical protein n=1 Tax=Paraburkholderia hayleyella TaxID=2152889 RepID=UPI001291415F|nr:hypothetical protein [Paraburkholderia hayleyella]